MKIVVIGSYNTDMIIRVPRIPRPGETILGGRFLTAAGGKGANQAVAAARAGGDVTFIAGIGRDSMGDQALQGFQQDGIDTSCVYRDEAEPSGAALIFVDEEGENSIAVAGGANMTLSPAKIRACARIIESADILVMQLETPLDTIQAAADLAHAKQVPVILNPAPAGQLPDELLGKITILTPNESETELLTGVDVTGSESASEAAAALKDRGVEHIVITMGRRGAFVSSAEMEDMVPGFEVEAADTTAAGDVFNGALSVAVSEQRPLPEAVRFACAAAALSVTREGAQPSVPRRNEIESFLQAH